MLRDLTDVPADEVGAERARVATEGNVEFSAALKDTDDGLRGFELKDSDG